MILHYHLCLYELTGGTNIDGDDDGAGDGLIIVVAVLSVLLIVTLLCIVVLIVWIIKLNKKIMELKRE